MLEVNNISNVPPFSNPTDEHNYKIRIIDYICENLQLSLQANLKSNTVVTNHQSGNGDD